MIGSNGFTYNLFIQSNMTMKKNISNDLFVFYICDFISLTIVLNRGILQLFQIELCNVQTDIYEILYNVD